MTEGSCRFCDAPLEHVVVDLGVSPLSNSYLSADDLWQMEPHYPLRVLACGDCALVQLREFEPPERIFSAEYAYFSSYSTSWLEHARRYTESVVARLGLDERSKVVEVASNDGYLLRWFAERGIPVLGIEPTANTAAAAVEQGIPTIVRFFGRALATELHEEHGADLLIGNNVLAHVPDLNDFVAGLAVLLKPAGVLTLEFPHLMRLLDEVQFDTIYHEHFSYFSLLTAERVLAAHGLVVFDVEELPTHGGSLRVFARHADDATKPVAPAVDALRERELAAGHDRAETYVEFGPRVEEDKRRILDFFVDSKDRGLAVAGYGAPAKGNTLLNYCGMGTDFVDYTVDRNPHKQGLHLPGSRIPIRSPEAIAETRPDLVFILPWNLRDEVMAQMAHVREWGGRFVARSPDLRVFA